MQTQTSLDRDFLSNAATNVFRQVPDFRRQEFIEIELKDFLMAGLSIFTLKFPSLLQYDENFRKKFGRSVIQKLFKMEKVPSDTRMREVLDEIDPQNVRPLFKTLLQKVQRAGRLSDFRSFDGSYIMALDASGYFYSEDIHCSKCLVKKHKGTNSKDTYSHQMMVGTFVHPNLKQVLPICPEAIQVQDGSEKNDCEQNGAKRLITKFREDFPKLTVTVVGDAIYSTLPMSKHFIANELSYMLSVKPGSHQTLFEVLNKWESLNKINHKSIEEQIGDKIKKKVIHDFEWTNGILLNTTDLRFSVNVLNYWQTTQWVNKDGELKEEVTHFTWITDKTITEGNLWELMKVGRSRWKIENETFNTLKNQGYEFEHNFGHGHKYLTDTMAHLMMSAFLIDQITDLACKVFQEVRRVHGSSNRSFWENIRATAISPFVEFSDWREMFLALTKRLKEIQMELVS